jgi:protoheme IX farnesyltransferase
MAIAFNILSDKIRVYLELMKLRLAWLVAFSGAFGYSLAIEKVEWESLVIFLLAAFSITGAANIINQIVEKDLDKLMKRTQNSPLPSGRISAQEATWLAVVLFSGASFVFLISKSVFVIGG